MKNQQIIAILLLTLAVLAFAFTFKNIKKGSLSGKSSIISTITKSPDSMPNPITIGPDKIPHVSYDFLLTASTTASTDVLDCFGTTLEDLQANIAWTSSYTEEGTFCNMVFVETDSEGNELQVIKEYSISPGGFHIILSPYITGLFGEMELTEGKSYEFPQRNSYSDGHIILGGTIGANISTLKDQFNIPANQQNVRLTVFSVDKQWSNNQTSFEKCIAFAAHYSSLSLPYGLYEHTWCEVEPKKWTLVERVLVKN